MKKKQKKSIFDLWNILPGTTTNLKLKEIVLIIGKAHKIFVPTLKHIRCVSSHSHRHFQPQNRKYWWEKYIIYSLYFHRWLIFSVCVCTYVCKSEWNWLDLISHSFRHMIEMMPSYGRINMRVCVSVYYIQRNSIVVILTSFNCDCHRFDNSCLLFFILSMCVCFFQANFDFFFSDFISIHVWKKSFRLFFLTENGN